MKQVLLFILFPFLLYGQSQIGSDIDGEAADDFSGVSISLSSDGLVVAIGAGGNDANGNNSGHVRIYENQSGVWTKIGDDIDGEAAFDGAGRVSLSSDGSIVAIGAAGNAGINGGSSGHVRIYENQSGVWTKIGADIDGEFGDDQSGVSVSLSSDGLVVAIGANNNDANGNNSGHVRIYENQSDVWTKIGADIDGEAAFDESGESISLSSDGLVVAIGAIYNDANGNSSGHVRIYENQSGVWTKIGADIDGEATFDESGRSVSLSSDGLVVAIGAAGNGGFSGHVRIYENQSGVWTQVGADIDGEATNDNSGTSVSLSSDGSVVAIGALGNGGFSGHVRIYENQSGVWTKIGADIDGEAGGDQSGTSVSLSSDGSVVAIGAPLNDGNGSNSGHVRMYDLSALLSSNSFVLSQFNLYPNPVKEQFTIQLTQGIELQKVNIYNNLGQFISFTTKSIIDTTGLSSGLYYVEVISNKGKATKKIVVE